MSAIDYTSIIEYNNIPGKIARANLKSGNILVNRSAFRDLNPASRYFVLCHERAHILFQTRDEKLCDEFAMNMLLEKGYPLSEILKSLTQLLNYNNAEHYGRSLELFNKLRAYDYHVNGNEKVLKPLNTSRIMNTPGIVFNEDFSRQALESHYEDFLGKLLTGKTADERKDARAERKNERIATRAAGRAEVAAAGGGLSGIAKGFGSALGGILNSDAGVAAVSGLTGGGMAGGLSGMLGGTGGSNGGSSAQEAAPAKSGKNIVFIIVIVALIALFVYFAFFRKPKK